MIDKVTQISPPPALLSHDPSGGMAELLLTGVYVDEI